MTRETARQSVLEVAARPARLVRAHLAETYDGIGSVVRVSMTRGGVTNAFNARIAAGDFGGGRTFPEGTPVVVSTVNGQLEVFLGNIPVKCSCPQSSFFDCFDETDLLDSRDDLSDGTVGPIQRFPNELWQVATKGNVTDCGISEGSLFALLQANFIGGPHNFGIITPFTADPELADYFTTHKRYRGKFKLDHMPLQATNSVYFEVDFSGASLEIVMSTDGFIRLNTNTTKFKSDWDADTWYQFLWEYEPSFSGGISQVKVWKCSDPEPSDWDVVEAPPNPAGGSGRLSLTIGRNFQVNPIGDTDIKAEIDWIAAEPA